MIGREAAPVVLFVLLQRRRCPAALRLGRERSSIPRPFVRRVTSTQKKNCPRQVWTGGRELRSLPSASARHPITETEKRNYELRCGVLVLFVYRVSTNPRRAYRYDMMERFIEMRRRVDFRRRTPAFHVQTNWNKGRRGNSGSRKWKWRVEVVDKFSANLTTTRRKLFSALFRNHHGRICVCDARYRRRG